MDMFINISVILLFLQVMIAIVLFPRIEAMYIRWRKQRHLKPAKPWKLSKETPREIMRRRSIHPLEISSLRCHRTDDYGQLVRCPSVLYYIADKYDKELEKNRMASKRASDRDIAEQRASEQARRRLTEEMERHANKLRRKRELEIYNARKANFKRFATDRMIGLGRHRNIVDPATLQNK